MSLVFPSWSPPARAEKSAAETAVSSAAGKGGEIAFRFLVGLLHDAGCTGDVNLDRANQYMCNVMASVSGKGEDQWKAKVEKQLQQISAQLSVITSGQEKILNEIQTSHRSMMSEFEQAATKVTATKALVTIEGLWKKFRAEFTNSADVSRAEMLEFATNIVDQKLDKALQNLNVALTTSIIDGQPMLRYPFHYWRTTNGRRVSYELDARSVYDFAEKKFMDYRYSQQKAETMYLWAATVIESKCRLEREKGQTGECLPKLPVSTTSFKKDLARYSDEQVKVFNAAVDGFLLSYGLPRGGSPRFLPATAEEVLLRANFLTTSLVAPSGQGMWGRVFSMGNAWDGTLQMQCGGLQTVKPALDYAVTVENFSAQDPATGPLDWWVASRGDSTYDKVRFATQWKVYHYSLPKAAAGRGKLTPTSLYLTK